MNALLQQRVQPSEDCPVLRIFLCRPRDLATYTELIHVFLVGCRRLPLPQQYHGGAVVKTFVIEIRLSRFCNYFCCAVVHVSANAIKYFWHEQVSSIGPSQNVVGELLALRPLPAPNFRFLRFSPNFSEVCPEYSPALPRTN